MKTFFYLILTSLISTGAFMGGLNQTNPLPGYLIGFAVWGLFFWGWHRRSKKAMEKRMRERLFEDYMRNKAWQRS